MKVAATYSIKGGVGKTSTAVNLAYEAGRAGVRVLVWDLDPQGAATYLFRVRPKVRGGSRRLVSAKGALRRPHPRHRPRRGARRPGRLLAPPPRPPPRGHARTPLARLATLLEPVRDALRPGPPRLPAEHLAGQRERVRRRRRAARARGAGHPRQPHPRPADVDFLDDQLDAPAVLPFLSMVDRRRRLHRELVESLGVRLAGAARAPPCPAAAVIERMGTERAPVGVYAPNTPATRAYRRLWTEVAAGLWGAA